MMEADVTAACGTATFDEADGVGYRYSWQALQGRVAGGSFTLRLPQIPA